MKKLLQISALFLALQGLAHAAAIESAAALRTPGSDTQLGSNILRGTHADAAFNAARGKYRLDDGSTLRLYRDHEKFLAELGDRQAVEVRPVGDGEFVAVAGELKLKFLQNAGGQVEGVVVSRNI